MAPCGAGDEIPTAESASPLSANPGLRVICPRTSRRSSVAVGEPIRAGTKRWVLTTLMFAVSSCRREYSFAPDRAFQIDRR